MFRFFGLVCMFSFIPLVSEAAVIINEIAWMGDGESANNEWIELYNNGGNSISVDGWTLTDGMNLDIQLAGTVGAGQYAVLERTDDDSASGNAFLIYVGALTNTGATLTLKRTDGSIEDQVGGGESWENIGGDNVTKETAQYTAGGWITAKATPGTENATEGSKSHSEDAQTSSNGGTLKNGTLVKKSAALELPDDTLSLEIVAPTVVYVHQPISLTVKPSGLGKTIMESLVYSWNFGDVTSGKGSEVAHQYAYPGEYVVVVHGAYARHEQVARAYITVLPVAFSITRNSRGDIQVHNDSKYEVDISGYMIRGVKSFVFPKHSILLAGATLTIPKEKLSIQNEHAVLLYDQEKSLVATSFQEVAPAKISQVVAPPVYKVAVNKDIEPDTEDFAFASEKQNEVVATEHDISNAVITPELPQKESKVPNSVFPYLGLIGVLSLAFVGLFNRKMK